MKRSSWLGMFLFGLGMRFQVLGSSLCFTEIFVYAAAPILFSSEWRYMRRNGMAVLFWLALLTMFCSAVSCLANHSSQYAVLRGLAVTSVLPCAVVVCHWMLRRNLMSIKWMLLGWALSNFLCTFIFRQSVEVAMSSGGTADDIMAGPIYWISRVSSFVTLYPKGWYLQCPIVLSAMAPLGLAVFAMATSASGRSAALGAIAAAGIVFLGGKSRAGIFRRFCRRFWLIVGLAVLGVLLANVFYRTAAQRGWLGESARTKYEAQTHGDKKASVLKVLMGGRIEFFAGFYACLRRPLVGYGPWAIDYDGIYYDFLCKYGNPDDFEKYNRTREVEIMSGKLGMIPAHSYLVGFWLWYGVFGFIFWLYVIFVFLRYLRQDCYAVPQWFMWLAAGIPGYLWGVFFSPFADRVNAVMFIVACLMARAVRQGRQPLPRNMIMEILKHDR